MKERIVVAMSGGVDSAVVASMLKQKGYDVVGVTLKLFENESGSKKCCSIDDILDARATAAKIGIPHYVIDETKLFQESVIDDFIKSYTKGITPLPCARCNGMVKIKSLISFAKSIDAKSVATGHYAKIVNGKRGKEIHRSGNRLKDQTHFLYALSQEEIDFLVFPLEDMSKEEVRSVARDFDLFVSEKEESQDICFVPNGYVDFVKKNSTYKDVEGKIVHIKTGEELGFHAGVINYTIGQRKGLGVAYAEALYVAKIDVEKNIVYVGSEKDLYSQAFYISSFNNLAPEFVDNDMLNNISICVRALKPTVNAKIKILKNKNESNASGLVEPEFLVRAVTIGQVCAVYKGERLLGGGIINGIVDLL